MIGKNQFLIYNEIIYSLNKCQELNDLKNLFFPRLKMLIPFSYASILLYHINEKTSEFTFRTPICFPDFFIEAEEEYIRHSDKDDLLWLMHSKESTLIRESDVIDEEKRVNSYIYKHCYARYKIYDTLQYNITYEGSILGVLTLHRTKIDGIFSDEEMFYLRSCGTHLNLLIHHILEYKENTGYISETDLETLRTKYTLTNRETQLLSLIHQYYNIDEMAQKLQITEHTVQKHLQNLFKKMNVASRWDVLRIRS